MDAQPRNALKVTTPSDLEIVLTRTFDAPAALVFEAVTKVEHVRVWWGCSDNPESTFEIDFRVGGKWRYVLRGPQGEHAFHGEYLEIEPPHRIVSTEIYEPFAEHGSVVTMVLEERDGRTTLTSTVRHKTKEGRDGHLGAGMEVGAGQSFDRLEQLLWELQGTAS